jgi:hypothetical protein
MECHDTLFGPFRIVDGGIMDRAYENILKLSRTGQRRKDMKQQ